MKFMATWTIPTTNQREAARRFLASGAPAPEGLTMLGRWHVPGSGRGFALCESDDLVAIGTHLAEWGNLLELEVVPVVEDEEAGMAIAAGTGAGSG